MLRRAPTRLEKYDTDVVPLVNGTSCVLCVEVERAMADVAEGSYASTEVRHRCCAPAEWY